MAAPFTRSSLGRGPAMITWNSGTIWTRDDCVPRHDPVWHPATTSMYGRVDKYKSDLVIKISLPIWGAFENLSILFPSAVLNPTIGSSIFGTSDLTLTILARNGDQIVYTNAQLTKLANLHLGVDAELWSADAEFTCLCGNSNNPEDAGAYYVLSTGVSYSDSLFAKTNFLKTRWTAAWAAQTGFTTFVGQKGFDIGWDLELTPVVVDGWGTRDMTLANFAGTCRCIPIGPTLAQIEALQKATNLALGAQLGTGAATLTLTGSSHSIVLNYASIASHGYAFGVAPLRVGEMTWETVRGFSAGAPAAVATVS